MQNLLLTFAQNDAGATGALFAGGFMILWVLLAIVGAVLWVWALVSAIQNPGLDSTTRLLWVLVIVFTGFIGAIVYLIIGRDSQKMTPA